MWVDNYEQFNIDLLPNEPCIEAEMLSGGIQPGSNWPTEIDRALLNAFAIVLFWSGNWDSDRAVLAREHGVALAQHRIGKARYLPVFLDRPATLPDALVRYRTESGDLVQAYDVANCGNTQWTKLVDDLDVAWCAMQPGAPIPSHKMNWEAELTRASDDIHIIALLLRFPLGPAVDTYLIRQAVRQAFARGSDTVGAPATIAESANLVLASLGHRPPNPEAFVVTPATLPSPALGLLQYWSAALDMACMMGPRMLAALVLLAPPAVKNGKRNELASLLARLEEKE